MHTRQRLAFGRPLRFSPYAVGLLGFAAFLGAITHPREGRACSCAAPPSLVGPLPSPGATDVPTNTKILLPAFLGEPRPALVMRDEDGNETATTATTIFGVDDWIAGAIIVSPDTQLVPNTRYEVIAGDSVDPVTEFHTGAEIFDVAPLSPTASVDETWSYYNVPISTCGPESHGASFNVSVDAQASTLLLITNTADAFDAQALAGTVSRVQVAALAEAGPVLVGRGVCLASWDEAGPLATAEFQFATIGPTGLFSGWSSPVPVELPGPLGCSHTASSASGLGGRGTDRPVSFVAVALSLVVFCSRRRRRTAAE